MAEAEAVAQALQPTDVILIVLIAVVVFYLLPRQACHRVLANDRIMPCPCKCRATVTARQRVMLGRCSARYSTTTVEPPASQAAERTRHDEARRAPAAPHLPPQRPLSFARRCTLPRRAPQADAQRCEYLVFCLWSARATARSLGRGWRRSARRTR